MDTEMRTPIVACLLFLLLAMVKATSVEITQEWKRDYGWELVCHWLLDMDDSLQSVTLSKNQQQFLIFRPENINGELRKASTFNLTETVMSVDCMASVEKGIKGRCRLNIEPLVPFRKDFTFGCAVSGERPYFKIAEKEIIVEAFVPPSDAVMVVTNSETGPATINCTSSGAPAPKIVWTIDNQTVPHNFHNSVWNSTSKLWNVWSTFTPQYDSSEKVQCTPEVSKGSQQIKGKSVQYNNAYRLFLDAAILTFALSSLYLL